jgi:hypothetical protein
MDFAPGLRLPFGGRKQVHNTYSFGDGILRETPGEMAPSGVRYRLGGARVRLGDHPYAKELASLGLPKRALFSSSADNVEMSFSDAKESHDPDPARHQTRYRPHQRQLLLRSRRTRGLPLDARPRPVFRDRNGLAAAATYQAVIEAERDPETFSNTGGIRPDNPGMPYMIDMDDPALLRRKLVNAGFTRKRVMDKMSSIDTLCDSLIDAVCERGECDFVATSPPRCRWPSSATCSVCCPRSARRC